MIILTKTKKQLLQQFIAKHPGHHLVWLFQCMLNDDQIIEFNVIRDLIITAKNQKVLSISEIQQADILEANLSLAKE